MKGGQGRKETKREGQEKESQEREKPREYMTKMARLYRNEKMEEEKPMSWRNLE